MLRTSCASRAAGLLGFLLVAQAASAATLVATVGDSLADSIYLALLSRPDLLKRYEIQVTRWSHPVIGLARSDYFDYLTWLKNSPPAAAADFCIVQIGTNDIQGIPAGGKNRWLAYGSEPWKSAYRNRVAEVWRILNRGRCKEVLWILQPGFEKRSFLARNRDLINQLQSDALASAGVKLFDLHTTGAAYGRDEIHFNREFDLQLGGAVTRAIVFSRQALADCGVCHGGATVRNVLSHRDIAPLSLLPAVPPVAR
jgi:hypothetical protein